MIRLIEKRPILTIIIVVGVLLLPFLDVLEVTIMEARNFVTAREMLIDGNWVLTTMNGEPRYEKPPLPTWLSAFSASIFGVKSVWGMRFPTVIMVMLLGSMVFMLSRKLTLTKRLSLINGLVAVTSLYVVLIIFEAPWDIYAHAFMLASIYFMVRILNQQLFKNILLDGSLAALFIGVSVLSKGPVSLYVLFLPFLIAYVVVYKKRVVKKRWLSLFVIVITGMLLGFSWYGYVRAVDPETFAAIASKETGNWTSYNVRPFYYYWSFFVQSGLWTIPAFISLLYPYLKTRVCNLKGYQFTVLWTIIAVVLLSIIPEKKSRYLMPVLIPLALNVGFYIEYLIREFKDLRDKRETLPVYFNFGLLIFVFTVIPFALVYAVIFEQVLINSIGVVAFALVLITALFAGYSLFKKNIHHIFLGIIAALVFTAIGGFSIVKGNIANESYSPFDEIKLDDGLPLYSFDIDAPEVFWGSNRKMKVLDWINHGLITDDSFYLLVSFDCEEIMETDFNSYNAEFVQNFDLNFNSPESKAYKDRKAGKIYKITRVVYLATIVE